MSVHVFHAAFGSVFSLVATVDTNDLDDAYTKTNNITDNWVNNSGVNAVNLLESPNGLKGHRSTSIDDFMVKDGVAYRVAVFGFDKVEDEKEYYINLSIGGGDIIETTIPGKKLIEIMKKMIDRGY